MSGQREFAHLDPCEVLGVSPTCPTLEVRRAFRKLALKWHPDKHEQATPEQKAHAELQFKKVAWAYEVLSTKTKREAFFSSFSDERHQAPFDFSSFWEEWGPSSWESFFNRNTETEIPEENLDRIRQLWDEEEAITDEERLERTLVTPIEPASSVEVWQQFGTVHLLPPSGVGRHPPSCNSHFNSIVACWSGSLVGLRVDAIVNAANIALAGGGGIDGAIHYGAGEKLYLECDLIGGCKTGNVAITRAYLLPSKFIIHACGPIGKRPKQLSTCYSNALDVAVKHNIRSIAFPCISTGAYHYPLESATNVALHTVRHWLETGDNSSKMDLIVFGCFLDKEMAAYKKWMQWYFPLLPPDNDVLPPAEVQHLLAAPFEELLFPSQEEEEFSE